MNTIYFDPYGSEKTDIPVFPLHRKNLDLPIYYCRPDSPLPTRRSFEQVFPTGFYPKGNGELYLSITGREWQDRRLAYCYRTFRGDQPALRRLTLGHIFLVRYEFREYWQPEDWLQTVLSYHDHILPDWISSGSFSLVQSLGEVMADRLVAKSLYSDIQRLGLTCSEMPIGCDIEDWKKTHHA